MGQPPVNLHAFDLDADEREHKALVRGLMELHNKRHNEERQRVSTRFRKDLSFMRELREKQQKRNAQFVKEEARNAHYTQTAMKCQVQLRRWLARRSVDKLRIQAAVKYGWVTRKMADNNPEVALRTYTNIVRLAQFGIRLVRASVRMRKELVKREARHRQRQLQKSGGGRALPLNRATMGKIEEKRHLLQGMAEDNTEVSKEITAAHANASMRRASTSMRSTSTTGSSFKRPNL